MLQNINPGTIVDIEKGEDDSLLFLFMALNESLRGWAKCKPIIVVDETFLKPAYGGTLLSASAHDAGATMYTEKKFEYHIKDLDSLDKRIRPYLQKNGYHKCSRFYSKNKRYSVMTSNIAESLNSATVAAREVPITTLLECLRGLLQDWTYTNRKLAQKTMTRLTPVAEQALTNNFVYSLRLTVKPANEYLFEVLKEDESWIVNLKERICTCNRFQKDEMPCAHALDVMKEMNIDPYDYCSHYYTTKVWLETYDAIV
ncbi:uncharacterized protein LOC133780036 [Humulus lupulus]|uniref:uncharacterized protein LOC133780036 n=1 Tax=Humulus lupulus TaxID=3486 RepID=UPI002B411476|nr:uncharacterized protein LOC133780036 [Humulus lupulus]